MDLSLEQLDKRYQEIPLPIREALSSEEFSEKIFTIGEEHGLLLDQSDSLAETVALTMLGEIPLEKFHEKIQILGVPEEIVSAITKDINEKILQPLKEDLQHIGERGEASREDILREIENPSPSRFTRATPAPSIIETHNYKVLGSEKSETFIPPQIPTEVLPSLPPTIDPSHEIDAPHIVTPSSVEKPSLPPITQTSATTPIPPQAPKPTPPSQPITQAPRTVTEIKSVQAEKRRTIDPYREPIE